MMNVQRLPDPVRPLAHHHRLRHAWLSALMLTVASVASAHLEALNLSIVVRAQSIVLRAASQEGYPIQGAKFEYRLVSPGGETFRRPMREGENGEYTAPKPDAPRGSYALKVSDTTFPGESLEATAEVQWPLAGSVTLVMPPEEENEGMQRSNLVPAILGGLALAALAAFAWWRTARARPA